MSMATDEAARGPLTNGGGTYMGAERRSQPDPSTATTQMILREIGALKELFESTKQYRAAEITSLKELMFTRIGAVEEGIKLSHENELTWPTKLDREMTATKDVINQQFQSVNRRFEERDVRHADNAREQKVAIDAAFKAASNVVTQQQESSEKAINKSENTFAKQIDSAVQSLFQVKNELDKRIEDGKERINEIASLVTAMQALNAGRKEVVVEAKDNTQLIFGAVGVLIGLGGLVAAFLARTAS